MPEPGREDPFGWVGATVDGKYRVDELVGEGGFGIVYRAHHLGFEQTVAVKCLRIPESLVGEERERFFASFLAEGRLLHNLSRATAGIVQALDVGAAQSPKGPWTPYIVLEWLDGRTLDEELEERAESGAGGLPLAEAFELMEPAIRALAIAHEQGIAHRDVKPANLFLARIGGRRTLKVLDFGIAKVLTETASLTKALEATGRSLQAFTPRYGSPEQFSRRFGATGPWSDVFSLALVLVEVASGRQALEGEDAAQLFVTAADSAHRPTLRALGVATSDAVEAVLQKALAVDPKQRYLDAAQLGDALALALSEGGDDALARLAPEPIPRSSPDAATVRFAAREAETHLASISQIPPEPRGARARGTRATPASIALAAAAATTAFALIGFLGHLVWSGPAPAASSSAVAALAASSAAPAAPAAPSDMPVAASSAAAPAAAAGAPPPALERDVPEGRGAGGTWFSRFHVARRKAAGPGFAEAQTACAHASMSLCSEPQWTRACEIDASVGKAASWTASADASGIVVRGGAGCGARHTAAASSGDGAAATLCCARAIGIDTSNTNPSFVAATAGRLAELERTRNQHDTNALLGLLADTVTVDGHARDKRAFGKLVDDSLRTWPDQWALIGSCAVSVQGRTVVRHTRRGNKRHTETVSWTAECNETRYRAGELAVVSTTYIFTGAGKLKSVADGRFVRDWSKL